MAKIVPSSLAPSEPLHISLASTSFELDGSKKTSAYETDDPTVLANARAHPWLDVQVAKGELVTAPVASRLDPTKDILSSQHPDAKLAFDAEAAKATLVEEAAVAPVAIDAGLDQDKVVKTNDVSETLAAAEKSTPKEKK